MGSWSESYSGNEIPPNIHGYNQVDQYKTITAGNFYVFQVTFTTVNEIGGGRGAICINSATNLLIESSSFIRCHSNGSGGAIYFNDPNGRSFLKNVCSTNSYSSYQDHFCYISTKSSDQCTNCMEHSSVANLKYTTRWNLYLCDSDIIILKYDNISKNECSANSAFWCIPSINSSVSYTSFENNTATDLDVIGFGNDHKHYMNTCNVIRNTANNNGAIIHVSDSLNISNSCLIENTKTMFTIFGSSSTCTIINCTIDSTYKSGGGIATVDSNSIPSQSFINNLNGLQYSECLFTEKYSNSKCVCMTFNMIGKRCNMLRRMDNYILLII